MASKNSEPHVAKDKSKEEINNIPLAVIRGTHAPTRADIGGWLYMVGSIEEDEAARQERDLESLGRQVRDDDTQNSGLDVKFLTSSGRDQTSELNPEHLGTISGDIPDFEPGDTIRVGCSVRAGFQNRVRYIEAVCIGRSSWGGILGSFTIRMISFGEGVEMTFPLDCVNIHSIALVRRGKVRRAKLYYLRTRRGGALRTIKDDDYLSK